MRHLSHAVVALSVLSAAAGANAADLKMPVKAPPAPMPPPFSWTGFYIGGNLGGAWVNNNVTDTLAGMNFGNNNSNAVFIGGGQVGFNYQAGNFAGGNFVWGVEADFDGASNNNNGNRLIVAGPLGLGHTFAVSLNNRWVATAAVRLGVAYDRALFYAKGGAGWVGFNGFTVTDLNIGASLNGGGSNSSDAGGLVGGGIEWAFADNWSIRFEYDALFFGGRTFTVPVGSPVLAGDTFTTGNRTLQMATVGINWRFGWGPYGPMVASRY
jgi:outer membrane immunogenic protein